MSYTIVKMIIGYPPRFTPGGGANQGPQFAGGLPKAGSIMTCNTGAWNGNGSPNFRFQWYVGTGSVANATNASYSISAGNAGSGLSCVVSAGNATWGTNYRVVQTATVMP
jgi:hypothetical protein